MISLVPNNIFFVEKIEHLSPLYAVPRCNSRQQLLAKLIICFANRNDVVYSDIIEVLIGSMQLVTLELLANSFIHKS